MARPRKVTKRVTITVQVDMSETQFKGLKADLKDMVSSLFDPGEVVYLAVDSETKD